MNENTDNELRAKSRVMILTAWDLKRYNDSGVEPPPADQVGHSASLSWEITFVRPGEMNNVCLSG